MINHDDIIISELKVSEIDETSWLLANSMCTNPNHLAIFKSMKLPVIAKQQQMFEMVLQNKKNKSFTAKLKGQLVGTMTYTSSEDCQLPPTAMLRSLPKFIKMFGNHLIPVLRWRMNWGKHDYKCKHIHFGPLAVHKDFQGLGIGKTLLNYFCIYLDATNQAGYLETDKEQNVALYKLFGFIVIGSETLFGNQNWFMLREHSTK